LRGRLPPSRYVIPLHLRRNLHTRAIIQRIPSLARRSYSK